MPQAAPTQTPWQQLMFAAKKPDGFAEVKQLFEKDKEFKHFLPRTAFKIITETAKSGSKETLHYLLKEKKILRDYRAGHDLTIPTPPAPLVFYAAQNPDKTMLASLPTLNDRPHNDIAKALLAGNETAIRRNRTNFKNENNKFEDFFGGNINPTALACAIGNTDTLHIMFHEFKMLPEDLPAFAAKCGSLPLLQFGFNAAAEAKQPLNLEKKDLYGKKAIHYASEQGFSDIVSALIQAGADYKSTEGRGESLLYTTVLNCNCDTDEFNSECKHLAVIKLLYEKGATLTIEHLVMLFTSRLPPLYTYPSKALLNFFIEKHPELLNQPIGEVYSYRTIFTCSIERELSFFRYLINKGAKLSTIEIK